jgi:hypothetical protein
MTGDKMNRRKKSLILSLILITAFVLGACAPAQSTATTAPVVAIVETSAPAVTTESPVVQPSASGVELNADYENAVPVEQQLIFGTLKLAGTEFSVTKEQATALLPLWTNLKTLSESMMPSQDGSNSQSQSDVQTQVSDLIKEIEAAMTPEQIKAISDMKITMDIAQTIMQEQNISMGGARGSGGGGQPPQGDPPAGAPDGSNGTGSPPAMPSGDNAGQPPSDGGQQAGNGQMHSGMLLQPELIDAVIQLMEKISST